MNNINDDNTSLKKECERLDKCLEESVKLQSHYAELLNMMDGGRRISFTKDSWIERMKNLKIVS